MAEITGVKGIVTIPIGALGFVVPAVTTSTASTPIIHVTRWTANVRRDILPRDTFDTTDNPKRKLGNMYDLAGTIEGFLDSASIVRVDHMRTEDALAVAGFKLESRTGIGYSFAGLFSNVRIDVPKNGPALFTCDFESDGEVTEL